jgi:hypothetical protein
LHTGCGRDVGEVKRAPLLQKNGSHCWLKECEAHHDTAFWALFSTASGCPWLLMTMTGVNSILAQQANQETRQLTAGQCSVGADVHLDVVGDQCRQSYPVANFAFEQ